MVRRIETGRGPQIQCSWGESSIASFWLRSAAAAVETHGRLASLTPRSWTKQRYLELPVKVRGSRGSRLLRKLQRVEIKRYKF
jgi:hypothetical protein